MKTETTFVLPSVTIALKAKKLLIAEGIDVTVIKRSSRDGGCSYGAAVPQKSSALAERILKIEGIPYTKAQS